MNNSINTNGRKRVVLPLLLTSILLLLVLLLLPSVASAAPTCLSGDWTPYGCIIVVQGRQAVWPMQWPDDVRYAVAIDPEATQ